LQIKDLRVRPLPSSTDSSTNRSRQIIFSPAPSSGNRSVEPVWTCGRTSQTRRRRPEKSVRTDQLGLRSQCVLRRTARFLALPVSARPHSFSAPRVHASTAQLSVRLPAWPNAYVVR